MNRRFSLALALLILGIVLMIFGQALKAEGATPTGTATNSVQVKQTGLERFLQIEHEWQVTHQK